MTDPPTLPRGVPPAFGSSSATCRHPTERTTGYGRYPTRLRRGRAINLRGLFDRRAEPTALRVCGAGCAGHAVGPAHPGRGRRLERARGCHDRKSLIGVAVAEV